MDIKDVKLLACLVTDARMPYSKIGKEISLTSDSVKKRVESLEKQGIIKSFKVNLNYSLLDFMEFDIYFSLKNYTETELKKIILFLSNHRLVTWVGTCFGRYDLRISLIVKTNSQVNDFLFECNSQFSSFIIETLILFVSKKYKINHKKNFLELFSTSGISLSFFKNDKKIYGTKKQTIVLDSFEKQLIRELNKNPRSSLVSLSESLGVTPENIKYRINQLEKNNVITSFSTIIDGTKLGKIWAVFLFDFSNIDFDEIITYVIKMKNVTAFLQLLGKWNFSVTVFANDVKEIHLLLMSIRNKFPDLIRGYELVLLFETFKYPALPEIVFEE
jgi:DNA-binding Lrp family transcriptional regulator